MACAGCALWMLVAWTWGVARCSSLDVVPLVLHNATIYTMAPSQPYASAVCARDGRVAVVGDDPSVLSSACAAGAHTVDLMGTTMVPGLTDSHAHLMMETVRRLRADLLPARSAAEAAQLAKAFQHAHPRLVDSAGGWVLGFGWDQTGWPGASFPSRQDLDGLFPDVPVFLEQLSGHACWVNSKALELAAADIPASGDPPGGHIERGGDGQPTGIFSDNAVDLLRKHFKLPSPADVDTALSEVFRDCVAHGLTGVHDLNANKTDLLLYERRRANGTLPLRVYAAVAATASDASPNDPRVATDDGLLTWRAVKLFADGAMGSWSAAMLEPYLDRPNVTGTLVYAKEALLGNVSRWASQGWQVNVHAIGDAANKQILDVFEELQGPRYGLGNDQRWRVEHAQILRAQDIPRFKSLGVIPSMQPSHVASDLLYAENRLGHDRASRSYAWRSLLRTGIPALPFGSDFPTAGQVPPMLGLHAAVTRQNVDGAPAGGFFPEERVTREQAIRGFTVDSAFASFREHELGSIQAGFLADFAIFDRDVLTVDAAQLLQATVVGTVVGGRVVYAAPSKRQDAATPAVAPLASVKRELAALVPAILRERSRNDAGMQDWPVRDALRRYTANAAEDSYVDIWV